MELTIQARNERDEVIAVGRVATMPSDVAGRHYAQDVVTIDAIGSGKITRITLYSAVLNLTFEAPFVDIGEPIRAGDRINFEWTEPVLTIHQDVRR